MAYNLTDPHCWRAGLRPAVGALRKLPGYELLNRSMHGDHTDNDALVGRLFGGKFKLSRCVGLGSSGSVYESTQISLGRTVAVKVLRPELAEDHRLIKRFQDEALAASRLNHPNTVSVLDYGHTKDGLLYIVMEYLRGPTLTQLVRQSIQQTGQPLAVPRVVELIRQILTGLEEAHAAGVVHADLKADNVVVERRRDGTEVAKVCDFGIARIVGAPNVTRKEKVICGTPEYMAPELVSGTEPTIASDVYAAGVLTYELLVGETPFVGSSSALDTLTRQVRETPTPPSRRRPDLVINEQVEAACMKALSKNPADRFASATAFRAALVHAVGRRPTGELDTTDVLCASCGVFSAAAFKFCPECGTPRESKPLRPTRDFGSHVLEDELDGSSTAAGGRQPTAPLDPHAATVEQRLDDNTKDFRPLATDGVFPLPMVNRSAEVAAVQSFLSGTDTGSMLHIVGPRGCGRSRLVRETCGEATRAGTYVYLAAPDPSGLAGPFYPVRAIVAAMLELPPVCPYEALGDAIERVGLTRRDLPGIAELFGNESDLWQLEPMVRRRELLASTVRVLRAAATASPTVLVFEDVDEYDAPSQELLRRLAELPGPERLQVIVTSDVDLVGSWPDSVTQVALAPLASDGLATVAMHIRSTTGNDALPDADTLECITAGDPGHVQQLIRYILEGGALEDATLSCPDLVAARFRLLPQAARRVLQASATMGGESTREQLHSMLGSAIGIAAVDDGLQLLDARGLIVVEQDIAWFHQSMVRDVAYAATPADVRRTLHGSAVRALESVTGDPAVLGHHHEHAGHLREAAELLAEAGDESVHQLDDRGACELYNRALDAARRLMLADDDPHTHSLFAEISVKLAEALRVRGEVGLARGLIDEARDYCRGATGLQAQLQRAFAHLYLTVGDIPAAAAATREAIGMALQTGNVDLLGELYLDLSTTHLRGGETRAAAAELEEGINLVTMGGGIDSESGPTELWRILLRLAQLYRSLDRRDQAIATAEAAAQHARRNRTAVGRARCEALLAELFDAAGDTDKASAHRHTAVDQMRRLGDRRGTAELLLAGSHATSTMARIRPSSLREARDLAREVGWTEGVAQAQRRLS